MTILILYFFLDESYFRGGAKTFLTWAQSPKTPHGAIMRLDS